VIPKIKRERHISVIQALRWLRQEDCEFEIHLGYIVRTCHEKKRAGGMAQAVEHLLSKYKALSSNPSTIKIIFLKE
jgi:hypothetical protein